MDTEDPVVFLQAETLAIQSLLIGLLKSLSRRDPTFAATAGEAFDYADNLLHSGFVNSGEPLMKAHLNRTLEMLSQFRSAVQGHSEPKHGI